MRRHKFLVRDLPRLITFLICVATQVVIARTPDKARDAEAGRADAEVRLFQNPAGNRDTLEKTPPMDFPRPASNPLWLTNRPGMAVADAEYVIVTPWALYESFEVFAQYKRSQGSSAVVVATEQIQALYADARDLPESIRRFLQDADRWWNTRFVLIGGDFDRVPVRRVPNLTTLEFLPETIPTDLYYAALEGEWNADGDDVIGEFPIDGSPTDELDFGAELMVGRAPVHDAVDVTVFINKTIQYQSTAGHAYRGRGVALAAENLVADPNSTVMVRVAEDVLREALAGLEPAPVVERRYGVPRAWPGWEPLDETLALARLGSGDFGWVLTALHGDSGRLLVANIADVLEPSELSSLANQPNYFVAFVLGAIAADLDADATLEILLRDSDGGCVAGLAHTVMSFVAPDVSLLGATLNEALGAPNVTLGNAMNTAREEWLQRSNTPFAKFVTLSWVLLGDPQLTVSPNQSVDGPAMAQGAALFAGRPNPSNPSTEIRYRVPRTQEVELTVFDMRGRRLAVLVQGIVEAGEHAVYWDGRDALGQPVGSGVYFYRMRSGSFQRTRKLVLVE